VLRYRLSEFGIVAEKDPRSAPLKRLQPVKRGQHAKGLTEVVGVDLTGIEPQPKGLVSRRVPVGRYAYHRAIGKHVVLAIDQPQFLAEIEILPLNPRRVAISGSVPVSIRGAALASSRSG
jgi:hypothetical protein